MCLIIHKPADAAVPEDLIRAAAMLNPDGWGLMGFGQGCSQDNGNDNDLLLLRREWVDVDEILNLERRLRGAEYVLHLRKRTRGGSAVENVHPFEVADGVYLMHTGTLRIEPRVPGMSDTWHLTHDMFRPLCTRWHGLFADPAFKSLLEASLAPENKLVLLDHSQRSLVTSNRQHGIELDGLWLSSSRWIDRMLFPLHSPLVPQERIYRASDVQFL